MGFPQCACFCLRVLVGWPPVEKECETPAFVMLASAKEELKSSECHVFANLVFISIRCGPERRVSKTDPRNPLPESPVWTLTGIRCWVLIGFQKPGASQVLTSPPPPSHSLLLGKHLPPVLCPPLQPPRLPAGGLDTRVPGGMGG